MSGLIEKKAAEVAVMNEFWKDMDNSDFRIPLVSIGQPTTDPKNGKPGHFNFNNGKSVETMKGIRMIVPRKTRVLYGNDGPSMCASDNFFEPAARIKSPMSTDCASCFASQWGSDCQQKTALWVKRGSKGKINPPQCKETYNILMADEHWAPFFIKFQGTQLKEVSEKVFSRLKFDFSGVPPFGVKFDMSLTHISTYYSAVFDNFSLIEDYSKGMDMYTEMSKTAQDILSKEHSQMDDEARARNVAESNFDDIPTPEEMPQFNDADVPF